MGLTKDQKRYLSHFSEPKFTSNRFVRMLLSGLYKNGINEINEEKLCEKLFYYYKDPKYKELFQDIVRERYANRVDIYDAMSYEKYMSGHIYWFDNDSERLHLNYKEGLDSSYYEKYLSEDGIELMNQMIEELVTTINIEKDCAYSLQICKTSPNRDYHLVHGNRDWEGELSQIIITDGSIKNDSKKEEEDSDIHYANPIKNDCWVTLKDCITRDMEVEKANYVVVQGLKDGVIKKLKIYTEIMDLEKLNQIRDIADSYYNFEEKGPLLVKKYFENDSK